MKQIKIDEDAHHILIDTKKSMKERGIESPTLSGAIRELNEKNKTTER